MPSKGRSPGTRRVYRYDWFPPGPPNLKIPLGPALPSLLGPRETIPSLQSRMLPPPTTKWHFKEKCQLVAAVCSDPPCVSAGRLLFACFSVTRPRQCWDRLGFRGVWPQIIAQGRGRVSEVGSSPCKGWNFFPSVSELLPLCVGVRLSSHGVLFGRASLTCPAGLARHPEGCHPLGWFIFPLKPSEEREREAELLLTLSSCEHLDSYKYYV